MKNLYSKVSKVNIDLTGHNTKNIETVLSALKVDAVKVDPAETRGDTQTRTAKVIIPAKIPTLTKDLRFETYTKQVNTWSEINKDVPENLKYQDLIKTLKKNKEVKNLP